MILAPIEGTAQLVGGAWSINTDRLIDCFIVQIILEATDTSNQFTFSITNKNSLTVYPRDEERNSTVESKMNRTNLNIPVSGKYTLAIAGATVVADTVKYLIQLREKE